MKGRIRVDMVCDLAPVDLAARIERRLETEGDCEGSVRKNHAMLFLRQDARHFWSPWLDLELREHPRGCQLAGKFGPHPEVWTMFVFLWSAMVAVWGFGGMFGVGQLMIGETPYGLYATGIATIGLLVSCGINITGQRATVDQRVILHRFVLDALEEEEAQPKGPGSDALVPGA